jgi:general secretion pathway protein N
MRAPALAALGIAAYAAFLAATMPASFVLARAQDVQPGKFDVISAQGTAWHGTAKVSFNTPGGPLAIDKVEWRWRPTRLIAGRFAFEVGASATGMEARYEGARTFSRWEVRDLVARGDAAAMTTLLPWIAPWGPQGQVTIASPELSTDGAELRGQARVEWKAAAVAISEVKPLGSYRADIVAEGHAGRVTVSTLEGALSIAGQGTLTPPTRFAFSGEARAEASRAAALEPLLNLLGPARADGARTIAWRVN